MVLCSVSCRVWSVIAGCSLMFAQVLKSTSKAPPWIPNTALGVLYNPGWTCAPAYSTFRQCQQREIVWYFLLIYFLSLIVLWKQSKLQSQNRGAETSRSTKRALLPKEKLIEQFVLGPLLQYNSCFIRMCEENSWNDLWPSFKRFIKNDADAGKWSPPSFQRETEPRGKGSTYSFAHQAVVEGQADELEGRLLDEVGVEDSYLGGFPRYVVRHRLPKAFRALLRYEEPRRTERRNGRSGTLLAGFTIKKTFLWGNIWDLGTASSFIPHWQKTQKPTSSQTPPALIKEMHLAL